MTLKLSDLFKLILFYLLVWINVWLLAPAWCENVTYFINLSWLRAVFFFAKTPGVVLRYSDSAKKGIGKEKCQKDKGWTSAPNLNYRSKQGTVYMHVVSN